MSNVIAAVAVETIKAKIEEYASEANYWNSMLNITLKQEGKKFSDTLNAGELTNYVEYKLWCELCHKRDALKELIAK